jgi:hypothetical protein
MNLITELCTLYSCETECTLLYGEITIAGIRGLPSSGLPSGSKLRMFGGW